MSVGRGNNKKYKFFVSIVCLLFLIFASSLTISLAIFRSDKSDVQQNSFGAVVLHDNSQYKYKSKIQNKLVGEEYLFNDIKLTVADNTNPVFIRAHVYFDSTNEVAKDKIKFNSFSIKNHENYTWSRFGDYWYLCDKSGNLMQLNSTKAGEVYVFLIQSDAVVPEMQGVLGDDEFVSCEIIVQSSLASNFSNTTNFSEINKSFDKNATETTKTGTYSVVFKQNGTTLSTQTINYGGKATIPEVTTAEGEVFLCWNTREDGSGANITNEQLGYITQNLTLFPMFENQKVLVTVVQSEGGTISPETQMVDWGSDLVMHFTPNKNYVLKRILIDGDPVGATSEYLLKRITGAVVVSAEFVSDYIVLDINGGAGEQPNVVYNGDQTKFMLEGNEPTKSGKEFYYYSTNSADNEQGQNGDRYDLGYWYDVPNTSGTTTLFAIYLTASSNYQTAQNYVVVPKNVSAIADSPVNMFSGTNNTVKFVTLPRQTSKIGKNAFANCSGLVGVSMSDFVTSIGESAFKSDSALTNFRAPTSLQTLSQTAFSGCTSLSKVKNLDATSITEIPNECFAGCSKLEEIVLPANISKIRLCAFAGSGLKTINLEDTKLEELGDSAFYSCSALTQVTVPSTLKTMGITVFMFSGITEVKNFAGTSVSKIESMAFYSSKLIQIEFPESLVSIDNSAFASCSELIRVGGLQNTKVTQILDGAFSGCSKLKNVIFPQTLLTLGGGAYSGCSALTNVTFNSNLKTIGANAFEGCSSLSQLTGLEKTVVATIGDSAFKDCTSLVDVSLPNTIQTIGANAFANCSGLATINFINDSNLSTLSVAANSFTGTTSDLKVNILDESHFDEYISKLNGKGFAENAFMFFLGNIDRKAYYKNAVWEKFHDAVITSTAGEHGTISPSGTIIYSLGSSASYVISPETGYKIKKILVDGVEIVVTAADGAAQRYEFVDIQKDHTISAEFEQRMFKITVVCGGNGKIEPSTTKDYAYGSEVAFVITPNDGYVIKDVLIDGVSNAKAKENAKYTFSNLRANHKIEVSFEVVTFTIVSSVGEGGTMSPNQITTIKNWGENHSVTYTPNDKFVISTIVVDGQALNLSEDVVSKPYTYTFSKITANHVISCQFESTQRTLTYDPNGGTFADGDSSKTQEYNAFSNQTITLISTNPTRIGYKFKSWNTMSDGSGKGNSDLAGKIYSSVFGKEDGWLYAIWEIKQFQITTEAGAHGTITESMTVDWGTTATVEMKPDEGYRVATYSIDGGNAINSTAKAGDSDYFTFRNITANHTISATFAPITYTIKYNGNGATSGSTADSIHTYDEEKELTANGFSRTGYNFAGWATISNGNVKYSNKQKVKNLSAEQDKVVELYAVWAANQYTVTFNPNGGTVSPTSQTVVYGQAYGAMPTPTRTGYAFGGWIGGKNLVNNNIQQNGWSGSSTTVDTNTGKYTFRTSPGGGTGNAWRSFYVDVSGYVGKKVSISGKISAISPNNATISNINIGQGNSSDFPYHIAGSSDRKQIYETSGNLPVTFSHTCTIIGGTSIMGICIWMKATGAGGYVDVTVENLQVEVAEAATSFESPNQSVDSSTIVKTARDHTLTATWTANKYNIKFQANDATITEQLWDYAGSAGYTSSNAGSYSKYKHNNSRTAELNEANYITFDGQLSFYTPIPIRLGHTFKGWYSAASGGVKVANSDGSLVANVSGFTGANKEWKSAKETTLYAQWTTNVYTYTIKMTDDDPGTTSNYTFGSTKTISDPTRAGYTFTGWSVVATLDGKRYGTINLDSTDFAYGALMYDKRYPSAVYFPLFYENAGISYTGKFASGQIRWREYTLAGEYVKNAGVSENPHSVSTDQYLSLWYYTGMSDSSTTLSWNGGKDFVIDANQVGNLTLTANWTANTYTVTFNPNGGSVSPTTKTVTYDSAYGDLPTPTKTGHTFKAWTNSPFSMSDWLINFVNRSPGVSAGSASVDIANNSITLTSTGGDTYTATYGNSADYKITLEQNTTYTFSWLQGSDFTPRCFVFVKPSASEAWDWTHTKEGGTKDAATGRYYITISTGTYTCAEIRFGVNGKSGSFKFYDAKIEKGSSPTPYETTSSTKMTTASDHTLYAQWTPNKYNVLFDTTNVTQYNYSASKTTNGVTITSNYDGTFTFNGTMTDSLYGLVSIPVNFKVGQQWQVFSTYVSGSYSAKSSGGHCFVLELNKSDGGTPSTRCKTDFGPSQSNAGQRVLHDTNETKLTTTEQANCTQLVFWVWISDANSAYVFNNYRFKLEVSMFPQKQVTYGLTYGTLETPVKTGQTFAGWYDSLSGGNLITSSSKVAIADNHTLYSAWQGSVQINVENSKYYSNVQYSTSNGKSGSIAHGGSITLTGMPTGTKVTISATVYGQRLVCSPNYGKSMTVTEGFRLNGVAHTNTTPNSKIISGTVTVSLDVRVINMEGYHSETTPLCCVAGDSLISMADGTQKQIKDINVGDKVWSYNATTQKLEETTVEGLFKVDRKEIVQITFADGTSLKITPDHPIFSERGWVAYSTESGRIAYPDVELQDQGTQIGDLIMSLSLLFDKEIISMQYIEGEFETYTLKVQNNSNFFAQSILVHNKPCQILPCCVDGETNITMADGTTKKAKDVVVGDEVLSYNDETKQYEKTTIEETINPYREKILEITFEDGSTLKITDDHPLLSARGWICYNTELGQMAYGTHGVSDKAMQVGDKIITETGAKTIASIKVIEFEDFEMVYTFRLANGLAFIANGNIVASVRK